MNEKPSVQEREFREHCYLMRYWQQAAEAEGYKMVARAVREIYRETGSLRETGRRLGFSWLAIRNKLLAMGEPLNMRGGANNPYGRAGGRSDDGKNIG